MYKYAPMRTARICDPFSVSKMFNGFENDKIVNFTRTFFLDIKKKFFNLFSSKLLYSIHSLKKLKIGLSGEF